MLTANVSISQSEILYACYIHEQDHAQNIENYTSRFECESTECFPVCLLVYFCSLSGFLFVCFLLLFERAGE